MPYVDNSRKIVIGHTLEELIFLLERVRGEGNDNGFIEVNAGDLNYVITRIILAYWKQRKRYQAINDIAGALNNAYLEFYRRVAVPYEELKAKQNGDVYIDYLKGGKNARNKSKKRSTAKKVKTKSR